MLGGAIGRQYDHGFRKWGGLGRVAGVIRFEWRHRRLTSLAVMFRFDMYCKLETMRSLAERRWYTFQGLIGCHCASILSELNPVVVESTLVWKRVK
jgi:hypothetical protein